MLLRSLFTLFLLLGQCAAGEVEVALSADGSVVDRVALSDDDDTPQSPIAKDAAPPIDEGTHERQSGTTGVLTALQQELATLEQMMQLQEKKLRVLGEVRSSWLEELQRVSTNDEELHQRKKSPADFADALEQKIDAAISVTEQEAVRFDAFFVESAEIPLDEPVADVKMVKLRANAAKELIAVAYSSGKITFYASPAVELLTVATERRGIRSIALSSLDDQPSLIVNYEDPFVAIYSFNLSEKSARVDADDETKGVHTVSMGPEYSLTIADHREIPLSSRASTVAIARAPRQLIATVAQTNGMIEFFALNGTSLRQLQTNATIAAMETRRSLLAFSNGSDVVLSSMTRAQEAEFSVCPGSLAEVSSIAFDALQPDIMYAGTQRGDILTYTVHAGNTHGCQLVSRSRIKHGERHQSSVVLATTKTFVIAAEPRHIAVFNVSRLRNGVALSKVAGSSWATPSNGAVVSFMAFSEGATGAHLALVMSSDGGQAKLVLFHALLPVEREVSEFPWTVFLYSAIVLAAVVGTQLYVRCQKPPTVNPWDSIGKRHESPYGKYDGLNVERPGDSDLNDNEYDRYHSLSDDLRRKIAQAKKGVKHYPIDEPEF